MHSPVAVPIMKLRWNFQRTYPASGSKMIFLGAFMNIPALLIVSLTTGNMFWCVSLTKMTHQEVSAVVSFLTGSEMWRKQICLWLSAGILLTMLQIFSVPGKHIICSHRTLAHLLGRSLLYSNYHAKAQLVHSELLYYYLRFNIRCSSTNHCQIEQTIITYNVHPWCNNILLTIHKYFDNNMIIIN